MCGLVGAYSFDGRPVDRDSLLRMRHLQRHRGPDDEGMRLFSLLAGASVDEHERLEGRATLEGGVGFNRLSILDTSAAGHQPMCSPDERAFIVYNGETYNAFEHVAELEARGHRFRSRSDTEVLLYLYREYGLDGMLERMNGMFAFALVDLDARAIYLVRDRLGIKPLYWYRRDSLLLFASEAKAFLGHPEFHPKVDEAALDEFLLLTYNAGDAFPLEDVHQLPPGHVLKVTPEGCELREYWHVPDRTIPASMSFAEAAEELERRLRLSVRRQLLSDVRLGCQLSGGIDSSMVNVLAAEEVGDGIDAVSMIPDDPAWSEERWMDLVTSTAGIRNHKQAVSGTSILANWKRAVWHMDQPTLGGHAAVLMQLAKAATPFVTVLLSGEGADELFGGYTRFANTAFRQRLGPLLPLLYRMPGRRGRGKTVLGDRWGQRDRVGAFISDHGLPADVFTALRPRGDIEALLSRRRAIFGDPSDDFLADCLRYDLRTYCVGLLIEQDKMTMANGIENRLPFLDHELVEWVRQLPTDYLVRGSLLPRHNVSKNTKRLLKLLAERRFGPAFAYRPKIGFDLPAHDYARHPAFVESMERELLPGMADRGLIDTTLVRRWWADFKGGDNAPAMSVLTIASVEVWARYFLDREAAPAPPADVPVA